MSAHKLNTRNAKRKRATSDVSESTESSDSVGSGPSTCNQNQLETNPTTTQETLKYGFRIINDQPQCVICYHTISNQTFRGIVQHLKLSHPTLQKDPVSTFQRQLHSLERMCAEEITKKKKTWIRYTFQRKVSLEKHNPYLKFGVRTLSNGCQQCLLCFRFFFSSSDYPKELQRHLRFTHLDYREQTVDFFIVKLLDVLKSQGIELNDQEITEELFIHEKELQFIKLGFRTLQKGHACILCFRLFSNEYSRFTKMKYHLETKHYAVKCEPLEFFLRKIFETEHKIEFEELIRYPMGDEELIKYGFRIFNKKVQCVLCGTFLKMESQYNPATLKNHMLYLHPKLKDSSVDYFQKLKLEMEKQSNYMNMNRDSFLKYGYRVKNSKLQCIFCLESIFQENPKFEELKLHLTQNHPLMANASIKLFKEKLMELEGDNNEIQDSIEPEFHLDKDCVKFGFRFYKDYYQCLVCLKGLSSRSSKVHFMRHFRTLHSHIELPAEEFFKKKLLSLELSDEEKALLALNKRPIFGESRSFFEDCGEDESVILFYESTQDDDLPEVQIVVQNEPIVMTEETQGGVLESEIETEDVKIEELMQIPPENPDDSLVENDPISLSPVAPSEEYVQLKEKLNNTQLFALQIDVPIFESISYLLTYVRFLSEDDIEEKLLFCKPLTDSNLLLTFLNAVQFYQLNWSNCVSIYTDCSRVELGKDSTFVKQIELMAPNVKWCRGLIDLHSFVTHKISNDLMVVLHDAVNIINLIKASTSRLSSVLNEKSGVFRQMLLHDTRYLSRGKVFNLLVELKREVAVFLTKEKFYLASVFWDPQWMIRLAYLADIFTHLNDFVVSIEGKDKNIIVLKKTAGAFVNKLSVWIERLEHGNLESFPALWNLVEAENYKDYFKTTKNLFMDHLVEIKSQLTDNFLPVHSIASSWIMDPFSIESVTKAGLQSEMHKELWTISSDQSLKAYFSERTIAQFWISMKDLYPKLLLLAAEKLVPFSNSCLCELGFSSLMELKIDGGGGINLERELMLNMNSSIVQML